MSPDSLSMDHSSSSCSAAAARRHQSRRRVSWCCAFNVPPLSPETLKASQRTHPHHTNTKTLLHRTSNGKPDKPRDSFSKLSSANSVPESPQSSKSSLSIVGRMDPRRILSPGRVSPIDSDPTHETYAAPDFPTSSRSASFRALAERISMTHLHSESFRASVESPRRVILQDPDPPVTESEPSENARNISDVRLNLRSKRGGCMVLELNSEIVCTNSELFAGLVAQYKKGVSGPGGVGGLSSSVCRIEIPDVENLGIFRETVELMFEEDIAKRLLKIGVYRCIDILEVSAGIGFTRAVMSCLKYIEAVPWTEEEEEKLRSVFTRLKFDESTVKNIMARLYILDAVSPQQNLTTRLISSITTTCTDVNARNELKSLVRGLLSKSSACEKDHCDVNKEEIYSICHSCISSLVSIFEESVSDENYSMSAKPLIKRISREVNNINWLLEILLDCQMGEEFVEIWMGQVRLIELHAVSSPMVRYELSRVSAVLFIGMGSRRVQCVSRVRSGLFQEWFMPMISDFGWLQRCRKGLEMKVLEDSMGQVLLTLPLKQQYALFMEWFRCFSKQGSECPNLSKAFQIWWRRSFLKGSETNVVEFR